MLSIASSVRKVIMLRRFAVIFSPPLILGALMFVLLGFVLVPAVFLLLSFSVALSLMFVSLSRLPANAVSAGLMGISRKLVGPPRSVVNVALMLILRMLVPPPLLTALIAVLPILSPLVLVRSLNLSPRLLS